MTQIDGLGKKFWAKVALQKFLCFQLLVLISQAFTPNFTQVVMQSLKKLKDSILPICIIRMRAKGLGYYIL